MFSSVFSAHKKKRRKSRWSTGCIPKKKYHSSPHVSRDEEHFGSDEDVDDGDDEVEKEGGAEDCDASGAQETQTNVDTEPAAAREGGSDATVEAESSQDEDTEREEKKPADEDVMTQEDDVQIKNKEEDDLQPEHSEKRRDERTENVSVNTNKESSAETQGDPLPTGPEQSEPQTVKEPSEEEQNRVASADEAKLTSPAEPMETEPTETGTGWTGNTETIKAYVTVWQQAVVLTLCVLSQSTPCSE